MSTCRSCGAEVVWVETEATAEKPGRKMPLDADPDKPGKALRVAGGNIVPTGARTGDGTPIARYIPSNPDVLACRSHFATCPNASQHRRR